MRFHWGGGLGTAHGHTSFPTLSCLQSTVKDGSMGWSRSGRSGQLKCTFGESLKGSDLAYLICPMGDHLQ